MKRLAVCSMLAFSAMLALPAMAGVAGADNPLMLHDTDAAAFLVVPAGDIHGAAVLDTSWDNATLGHLRPGDNAILPGMALDTLSETDADRHMAVNYGSGACSHLWSPGGAAGHIGSAT